MQFGFSLPSRGPAASTENLRMLAQHAEALGLDSVDDIARYAASGVSHLVLDVMSPHVAELQRVMERVVQEVKPGVGA